MSGWRRDQVLGGRAKIPDVPAFVCRNYWLLCLGRHDAPTYRHTIRKVKARVCSTTNTHLRAAAIPTNTPLRGRHTCCYCWLRCADGRVLLLGLTCTCAMLTVYTCVLFGVTFLCFLLRLSVFLPSSLSLSILIFVFLLFLSFLPSTHSEG